MPATSARSSINGRTTATVWLDHSACAERLECPVGPRCLLRRARAAPMAGRRCPGRSRKLRGRGSSMESRESRSPKRDAHEKKTAMANRNTKGRGRARVCGRSLPQGLDRRGGAPAPPRRLESVVGEQTKTMFTLRSTHEPEPPYPSLGLCFAYPCAEFFFPSPLCFESGLARRGDFDFLLHCLVVRGAGCFEASSNACFPISP
jgi:hypothetical protein